MMSQRLSKLVLTSHITTSIGWFGAVAVFLALATTALTSQDAQLASACCLAMNICVWLIIVPFCLASLLTGVIQAIGTKWGLFKHYWIVVKLFLTLASTLLLFLHLQPISYLANTATNIAFTSSQYGELISIISKAGTAIIVLLGIITISVHKPWGKIQKTLEVQNNSEPIENNYYSRKIYFILGLVVLIIIFILKHVFGGNMSH